MRKRLRRLHRNTTAPFGRIRDVSGAVKTLVFVEAAAAIEVTVATARLAADPLDRVVDLGQVPPWHWLWAAPLMGIAAGMLHALRPDRALRRWHGALLRRVDERFG